MTVRRIKGYIARKKNKLERIKRDLFYSQTAPEKEKVNLDIQKEAEKYHLEDRKIFQAELILENVKKSEKFSNTENRILLFTGKYRGENLAVNYFSQGESTEPLVQKINEVQKMYEECGCPSEGKKGFEKYISKPWAKLLERKMKEEEYKELSCLSSVQLFAKVLIYSR